MKIIRLLCASFALLLVLGTLYAQENDPRRILEKAAAAVGRNKVHGRILHEHVVDSFLQFAQSDRMYPPYYPVVNTRELWFDASTGVTRKNTSVTFFGFGPTPPSTTITDKENGAALRDSIARPTRGGLDELNAWDVLRDWLKSPSVRYGGEEVYRDYPRAILVRRGENGDEKLYVDPKTGFPVKLDRIEPHYLLGQVHVEYVYATWIQVDNTFVPSFACRISDGEPEIYRTVGESELVEAGKAPSMAIPETNGPPLPPSSLGIIPSPEPDTVRISNRIFLTHNLYYTEGCTLVDDTVYIFDATLGEQRARQDSSWIARVFPGSHAVVLIVSDLAWPHISGVRYWVARGATVVSHAMSEQFLGKIIERKWTLNPDLLERTRDHVRFRFVPVKKRYSLAGGAIQLFPIDGIASEGALIAFCRDDRFLWAGDYIQTNKFPTAYATEVWEAVQREGISPLRVAAQHLPVTPWSVIESLQRN